MSKSERAKVAHLGAVLHEATLYPAAFAGQAYEAATELLHLCRAKRGWIDRTRPPTELGDVVHEDAADIQASRPDLAGVLYRC